MASNTRFALFDAFDVIRIQPAASPHRSDMKFHERVENTFYESKSESFETSICFSDQSNCWWSYSDLPVRLKYEYHFSYLKVGIIVNGIAIHSIFFSYDKEFFRSSYLTTTLPPICAILMNKRKLIEYVHLYCNIL